MLSFDFRICCCGARSPPLLPHVDFLILRCCIVKFAPPPRAGWRLSAREEKPDSSHLLLLRRVVFHANAAVSCLSERSASPRGADDSLLACDDAIHGV